MRMSVGWRGLKALSAASQELDDSWDPEALTRSQ